ncbi:MAG: hypothetical protein QOC63_528 [Mycobacterium sp.]|jgi:diketogulonate reductase-like aldo/keto reductase|nr:hypothetical protein [Mycobacterium sp.]
MVNMKYIKLRDLDVSRIGWARWGCPTGTSAQVAIAWLLAHGDDFAPIPGTKRVSRVEEDVAADTIELSAEQLHKLNNLTPPAGDHHNEAQKQMIGR